MPLTDDEIKDARIEKLEKETKQLAWVAWGAYILAIVFSLMITHFATAANTSELKERLALQRVVVGMLAADGHSGEEIRTLLNRARADVELSVNEAR